MLRKSGFTLVELLVVIAIIGVLAGIVFAVGSSMLAKSQIKNTQGTILSLITASEQYRAVYYAYPNLDHPPTGYPGNDKNPKTNNIGGYSESDYREFNKRLRYMLEDRTYTVDEVTHDPFIGQANLPKIKDPGESVSDNKDMYSDAWGQFLRICPGRNHTKDTPPGPNNLDPNYNYATTGTKNRIGTPLDIFSISANGENDVDKTEPGSPYILETATMYNAEVNDDITSWLLDTKKIEEVIHKKK